MPLNWAVDPMPSAEPQLDVMVALLHAHAGCMLSPATAQALAGEQGVLAALPPVQKEPTWHKLGAELPAGQKEPGAAAQGRQVALLEAPTAVL